MSFKSSLSTTLGSDVGKIVLYVAVAGVAWYVWNAYTRQSNGRSLWSNLQGPDPGESWSYYLFGLGDAPGDSPQ